MTGKGYYLATFGIWRRHAPRFAHSHFVVLTSETDESPVDPEKESRASGASSTAAIGDDTRILVLVEADEGAHLTLEEDPNITTLPQPLAQKAVPESVQNALAEKGVTRGASTFEAAETLAKIHPLLRYRVF